METANQTVTYDEFGKSYLEFDLLASTNNPNIYFYVTVFRIEYNMEAFGPYIVSNNKLLVEIDDAFDNNYRVAQCLDDNNNGIGPQNVIQIIVDVKGINAVGLPLSLTPERMLHFRIEILPDLSGSNVLSDIFFRDTVTTSPNSSYTLTPDASFGAYIESYSATHYIDSSPIPITNSGSPSIASISPATVDAGVGDTLTIRGSGFGTLQGKVQFSSADDGGATFLKDLDDQYYEGLSWTDTEIQVRVPSLVYKGYEDDPELKYRGGAGTGPIQVQTANGQDSCQSSSVLNIRRSYTNYRYSDLLIHRTYLSKLNCDHDILFTLHTSAQGKQTAITAIDSALQRWSRLMDISLALERDGNGNLVYVSDKVISGRIKKNVIRFSDDNMPDLSSGMVIRKDYAPWYDTGGSQKFYMTNSSIQIRDSHPWHYPLTNPGSQQFSFYQAFLHEIGHALLLQHVNNPTDLMYYEIKTGDPIIDIYAGAPYVQAAAEMVAWSKSIVWEHLITPIQSPMTLGARFGRLTVSIERFDFNPPFYQANPADGFPPYSYHWEHTNASQGGLIACMVIPSEDAKERKINVSACSMKVTVTDKCGNQAEATVSPTKHLQADIDKSLSVFPNPNSGTFGITDVNNATVYLYNAAMMLTRTFENVSESANLDCGDLPAGLYILKIIDEEDVAVKKMILNK